MTLTVGMSKAGLALVGTLAVAAAAPALAQSNAHGLLNNPFVFNAGAFVIGSDVKARLNGQSSNNPEVDFDESLGGTNDATRGRVDALWRINPNHHLRFLYFNNSDSRSKVIDRDIAWGDNVFKAGGQVNTEMKNKTYELAYEYAFLRAPDYEVSASLGVHVMDISMQLSGNATVTRPDGSQSTATLTTRKDSFTAPLPVIGIRAGWVVAPQWYVDAQAQLFKINYGDYDGSWADLRVGATWMFSRNFGVGLGYNSFRTKLDVKKSDFDGQVKLGYAGLQLYLTGTF